jgi:hypothetical protein
MTETPAQLSELLLLDLEIGFPPADPSLQKHFLLLLKGFEMLHTLSGELQISPANPVKLTTPGEELLREGANLSGHFRLGKKALSSSGKLSHQHIQIFQLPQSSLQALRRFVPAFSIEINAEEGFQMKPPLLGALPDNLRHLPLADEGKPFPLKVPLPLHFIQISQAASIPVDLHSPSALIHGACKRALAPLLLKTYPGYRPASRRKGEASLKDKIALPGNPEP